MARAAVLLPLIAMAIAGCSRTSLEVPCPDGFGQRAQPRCDSAATDPPQMVLAEQTAQEVLSAGCDIVAVLATAPGPALRVSLDGGMSFGPARSLPPDALLQNLGAPRFEPLAMAEDGTLYVLSESAGGLQLRRSEDLGESWSEPVDIAASDDAWGPSIVVRGEEVAAYWLTSRQNPPAETWLARSRDGGRSFEPPVRIAGGRSAGASRPALCPAGEHGMVGGWLDCTGTDCSGDDRNGITRGMIAVSNGGQFSTDTLFELDNGVHFPRRARFRNARPGPRRGRRSRSAARRMRLAKRRLCAADRRPRFAECACQRGCRDSCRRRHTGEHSHARPSG